MHIPLYHAYTFAVSWLCCVLLCCYILYRTVRYVLCCGVWCGASKCNSVVSLVHTRLKSCLTLNPPPTKYRPMKTTITPKRSLSGSTHPRSRSECREVTVHRNATRDRHPCVYLHRAHRRTLRRLGAVCERDISRHDSRLEGRLRQLSYLARCNEAAVFRRSGSVHLVRILSLSFPSRLPWFR